MANLNSENPHVGRKFQETVRVILKEKYNACFEQEVAIPIGHPPKEHKFDLANGDRTIVAECKCYTWTDSGNVPHYKLQYLQRLGTLSKVRQVWYNETSIHTRI